jgi:hypothetical protein
VGLRCSHCAAIIDLSGNGGLGELRLEGALEDIFANGRNRAGSLSGIGLEVLPTFSPPR